MPSLAERIATWIRQQVVAAGARGLVVGLSGGVDSAVVARLCQLAMPGDALGVILPCQSNPQDELDAWFIGDHFSLPVTKVNLDGAYDALLVAAHVSTHLRQQVASASASPADPQARPPVANIKPRLRMATLYFLANSLNYLVAGTGNRSEIEIGYYTKYGDGGVDILPIGNLLKSQVRALALELDVPTAILEKAPSAGLWPGQTDETEIGFAYADLEAYVQGGPEAVSPALALRIERLMRASEHKRTPPPAPSIQ